MKEKQMAIGDKVSWQYTRGGYGFTRSIAAVVVAVYASRARIKVFNTTTGQTEVKTVHLNSLRPNRQNVVAGLDS